MNVFDGSIKNTELVVSDDKGFEISVTDSSAIDVDLCSLDVTFDNDITLTEYRTLDVVEEVTYSCFKSCLDATPATGNLGTYDKLFTISAQTGKTFAFKRGQPYLYEIVDATGAITKRTFRNYADTADVKVFGICNCVTASGYMWVAFDRIDTSPSEYEVWKYKYESGGNPSIAARVIFQQDSKLDFYANQIPIPLNLEVADIIEIKNNDGNGKLYVSFLRKNQIDGEPLIFTFEKQTSANYSWGNPGSWSGYLTNSINISAGDPTLLSNTYGAYLAHLFYHAGPTKVSQYNIKGDSVYLTSGYKPQWLLTDPYISTEKKGWKTYTIWGTTGGTTYYNASSYAVGTQVQTPDSIGWLSGGIKSYYNNLFNPELYNTLDVVVDGKDISVGMWGYAKGRWIKRGGKIEVADDNGTKYWFPVAGSAEILEIDGIVMFNARESGIDWSQHLQSTFNKGNFHLKGVSGTVYLDKGSGVDRSDQWWMMTLDSTTSILQGENMDRDSGKRTFINLAFSHNTNFSKKMVFLSEIYKHRECDDIKDCKLHIIKWENPPSGLAEYEQVIYGFKDRHPAKVVDEGDGIFPKKGLWIFSNNGLGTPPDYYVFMVPEKGTQYYEFGKITVQSDEYVNWKDEEYKVLGNTFTS